jgi:sulfiredoxin
MMKRETFAIADIYVPTKRRTTVEQRRVDDIAASMLDDGQRTPILVRADGARFVLVEGLHPRQPTIPSSSGRYSTGPLCCCAYVTTPFSVSEWSMRLKFIPSQLLGRRMDSLNDFFANTGIILRQLQN